MGYLMVAPGATTSAGIYSLLETDKANGLRSSPSLFRNILGDLPGTPFRQYLDI